MNIRKMNDEQLERIKGGGVTVWTGIAITAIVIFLSGVIEGITNPKRCNG